MTATYHPSPYAAALSALLADALPAHVTLVDVDYRDELTPEQVQSCIEGGSDVIREELDGSDWRYEAEMASAAYYADNLPSLLWELYDSDVDFRDEVLEVLRDRDDSDPVRDMIRQTPSVLMRYAVAVDVGTDTADAAVFDVAAALGLSGDEYLANRDAIASMLADSAPYVGPIYVVWYGDPGDVIAATDAHHYGNPEPSVIQWRDPYLVMLDGMNGAGADVQLDAVVSVPWDAGRVCVDSEGPGYSWTEVAGPYEPAYASDMTFPGWSA